MSEDCDNCRGEGEGGRRWLVDEETHGDMWGGEGGGGGGGGGGQMSMDDASIDINEMER